MRQERETSRKGELTIGIRRTVGAKCFRCCIKGLVVNRRAWLELPSFEHLSRKYGRSQGVDINNVWINSMLSQVVSERRATFYTGKERELA